MPDKPLRLTPQGQRSEFHPSRYHINPATGEPEFYPQPGTEEFDPDKALDKALERIDKDGTKTTTDQY